MSDDDPFRHAIDRLTTLRAAYAAFRAPLQARGPWPLALDSGDAPESSWGPPELLAHLGEMLPYWQGEFERIVEAARGPGDAVPFGRVSSDAIRQAILDRDRTIPVRELSTRIDDGIARWQARLAQAGPAEARAVGLHQTLGEMTAAALVERMVLGHLAEHRDQLERILAAP
jgi:hypothetical protein